MWIKGNYRRIFLDAHIDDWHEEFLSKINPEEIVSTLKASGAQSVVVKAKPHTGLCYWPSTIGRMHKGLKGRDYVGEMIEHCHQNGMDAVVYYSQIYDNWAYDHFPSWRCVYPDGMTSRERSFGFFKKGRYGIVCPNNKDYRAYVKANLQELNHNYRFAGIFLDMPFWPEICYCASCKERYYGETGKEMPKIIDWNNPDWLEFQNSRELWMAEFVAFSSACIKEINPEATIEHNFALALSPWPFAVTDLLMESCDYAAGDYYGGYLQQTFACKYYKNVSKLLPFVYITSRCDPDLSFHTTTKTKEEFILHAITALVHNGAFSLCDGMNPDGTIATEVYTDIMKKVFDETRPYEPLVSGNLISDVAIWVASRAKYTSANNGKNVRDLVGEAVLTGQIGMASILREYNIPFDIVGSQNLKDIKGRILVLSDIYNIREEEMTDLESYVRNGGYLYVSGHIGHLRLCEMMGVQYVGETDEIVTYMLPTKSGESVFSGFSDRNPLSVEGKQQIVTSEGKGTVLATMSLPYTREEGERFSSIHSNPPGLSTSHPSVIVTNVGKGTILWVAAPIEKSKPHMSKMVVRELLEQLYDQWSFRSNAPSCMEIVGWEKEGKHYFAAINQQESMPMSPIYDVYIEVPGPIIAAILAGKAERTELPAEYNGTHTKISLPKIDVFEVVEVSV